MQVCDRQKYISLPDEKYVLDARFPEIRIHYEQVIPGIAGSEVRYSRIHMSVQDNIRLQVFVNLEYTLGGGLFPDHGILSAADLYTFNGNRTIFSGSGFFALPYYSSATNDRYFQGSLQWHTDGFLFNKVPLFKQLKLQPVFSVQYLQTERIAHYVEIAAGLEHLFTILRLDYIYVPELIPGDLSGQHHYFCIGLGL
ncbi:MAG: DUF5686 family protein [Chitinophagales bacterium]